MRSESCTRSTDSGQGSTSSARESSASTSDDRLDETLQETFPASDAPANTAITAVRPAPIALNATRRSAMNVRPLRDRILASRIEEGEVRVGGIIVPDTAKEKPQQAKVIAVGTGAVTADGKTIPLVVKVGDQVLIGKYAGTEITLDGNVYLILREDEVLAVAENVPELATA
jgi:chaperonin GroES